VAMFLTSLVSLGEIEVQRERLMQVSVGSIWFLLLCIIDRDSEFSASDIILPSKGLTLNKHE